MPSRSKEAREARDEQLGQLGRREHYRRVRRDPDLTVVEGAQRVEHRRDRLRVRLSAAQQKAAQRLIGVWRSRPVDRTVNDPLVAGQAWKSRSAQR